jgi:hypothetical protein
MLYALLKIELRSLATGYNSFLCAALLMAARLAWNASSAFNRSIKVGCEWW